MTATEFNDDLPGAKWQRRADDQVTYLVTGVDRSGRRFRQVHEDYFTAININLWRGSVWEVQTSNGKRRLLKRVYN